MVEFKFNASDYKPWQGAEHDTPTQRAFRLWSGFQTDDEAPLTLEAACYLAQYDAEVYKSLWQKAVAEIDDLPDTVVAALGRALIRRKPRAGKEATARRNARLRAVAAVLAAEYGLPRRPTLHQLSIPEILSTLPDINLDPDSIYNNVLSKS